jgi:hypothetical protein
VLNVTPDEQGYGGASVLLQREMAKPAMRVPHGGGNSGFQPVVSD